MKRLTMIVALATLAACTPGVKPHNPGQAVYAAAADFLAAEQVANAYQSLHPCRENDLPGTCADPLLRVKLQTAKEVGEGKILQAEQIVADPNLTVGGEAQALAICKAALLALTDILAQLPKVTP